MKAVDVAFAGVLGQLELMRTGRLTSVELVELLLQRIVSLDPKINAFQTVLAHSARAEAAAADTSRAAGEVRPLLGVPIAVKDEMDVAGVVTTHGSRAYTRPARVDSEIVRRLRQAGAVIIGKTTMPEFGAWPFTSSKLAGVTRNPWDLSRTPGGSSGGSAAAVAAGLVPAATAADGGGSIRIPAACCGLFGLKPQRGRISTMPLPELWRGLGSYGFLTRSVGDAALLYETVWGAAPGDRWTAGAPRFAFDDAVTREVGPLRVALSRRSAVLGVRPHADATEALAQVGTALRTLGHEVTETDVRLPDPTLGFVPREAGGLAADLAATDDRSRVERRNRAYSATLTPFRALGPVADVVAKRATRKLEDFFHEYDLLVLPTMPSPPDAADAINGRGFVRTPLKSIAPVAYTAVFNVTGHPAAAVPAGFGADGLPRSVQLVARRDDEVTILQVAAQLERVVGWTAHRPPLGAD